MDITTLVILLVAIYYIYHSITSMEKVFNQRLDTLSSDIEKLERLQMSLLEQITTTQHLLEDHLKSNKVIDRYDDEP
jgi:F0F1-type ATP synthase membrane subunit b/b'